VQRFVRKELIQMLRLFVGPVLQHLSTVPSALPTLTVTARMVLLLVWVKAAIA
jgi:hypothetical protein